ncbi:MAG: hypothetical protein L0241_28845 [Planctomycetia bacterium]|nr:hypothetical protein [Planctomycetia bacterium]
MEPIGSKFGRFRREWLLFPTQSDSPVAQVHGKGRMSVEWRLATQRAIAGGSTAVVQHLALARWVAPDNKGTHPTDFWRWTTAA